MRFATSQDVLQSTKIEAIEQLASLGFDGIELVIPDGIHRIGSSGLELDPNYDDPESDMVFSDQGRSQLSRRSEKVGIELVSICLSSLNLREGLTSHREKEREEIRQFIERAIAAANDLGISTILVPFFQEASIGDRRERVRSELIGLSTVAEGAGVTLAIETDLNARENADLLGQIDSDSVRLYYDVGNAAWLENDPAEEIRRLHSHIQMVHVKDGVQGHSDAMLGNGVVDFDSVSSALRDVDFDGWIVLETTTKTDPAEDAYKNLEFVQKKFDPR